MVTTQFLLSLVLICTLFYVNDAFTKSNKINVGTSHMMWPFASQPAETGVPIIDAVLTKNKDSVVAILSRESSRVNDKDENGSNAMHIIAKQGHYKFPPDGIPKILIDYKINIDEKNGNGKTALEISLLSGWQKIAMLLLDNGADKSVVTEDVKRKITCPDCKRVVKQYNL